MNNILVFSLFLVLAGCAIFFLFYIIKLLRMKENNQTQNRANNQSLDQMKHLDHIVETCVAAINQKIVNPLKLTDNFMQQDREEAFIECKKRVYDIAPQKLMNDLPASFGDLDEWINTRIEYHVRMQKSGA